MRGPQRAAQSRRRIFANTNHRQGEPAAQRNAMIELVRKALGSEFAEADVRPEGAS